MYVNPFSNLTQPYIQSLTNTALTALNSSKANASSGITGTTAVPQDSSPQLSPFAQLMSTLQQIEASNPTQYAKVTRQIAANLQSASQTALATGNTVRAQELNTLATDFQSASANGQVPNVADLAQAMSGHGHPHGHHRQGNSNGAQSTDPVNIILNTLTGSGIEVGH